MWQSNNKPSSKQQTCSVCGKPKGEPIHGPCMEKIAHNATARRIGRNPEFIDNPMNKHDTNRRRSYTSEYRISMVLKGIDN